MKKRILTIIGSVVLAASILGGCSNAEERMEAYEEENGKVEKETQPVEQSDRHVKKKETAPKMPGMGDTAKVGDLEVIVQSRSTADTIGDDFLAEKANGKFIVLDITVKNSGKKAVSLFADMFVIKNDGAKLEHHMWATISANDNGGFNGDPLNPGSEQRATVVFDVAPDIADKDDITLEVKSSLFGGKTVEISLKK